MKCLNLTKETGKILGVHYSYNRKLEHEINFQSYVVKSILWLSHMRNLTIERKVLFFKSLPISKIVHQSLITTVSNTIIINATK